jgi:hypothetical protein
MPVAVFYDRIQRQGQRLPGQFVLCRLYLLNNNNVFGIQQMVCYAQFMG